MADRFYAGVDVGSSATKVVIVDGSGTVLSRALELSGMDFVTASKAWQIVLLLFLCAVVQQ